ncbi:GTPase ObgE [candidate division KSB1 bacterium]|nr:GTPase ObgE [candidate division KSB1 bacterium]
MFIDQAKISVQAGNGGNGCVSFRREKFVPHGGPNGGDGGNGGNIIFQVDTNLHTLLDFRYRTQFKAPRGEHGRGSNQFGKNGEDVVIRVPPGTMLRDLDSGEVIADLIEPDQRKIIAKGGRGGRGNARFVSSTNQAPRQCEAGKKGDFRNLQLELKLIADVGLVGPPNVGKSTLLSKLSSAKPKIDNYPFTTLSPNLGVVAYGDHQSFILADIPGLIEGAHQGKGLGIQFLNHILRTRLLVLMIDCQSNDYKHDYQMLQCELNSFSDEMARKPKIIAFTKIDICPDLPRSLKFDDDPKLPTCYISSATGKGLDSLIRLITENLSQIQENQIVYRR